MRILFASMPADGHFNPLTGIATHLSARGHDVRWYAGPEYGRKLHALGMTYFPYRRATEITGASLNDVPERAGLKGPRLISFDLEQFFVANVDNHFRDIVDIRAEFPFDVFFCDGAMYVEKLVADVLGVPVFSVGLTMVMPDGQSPPPFFGLRPARTIVGRTVHRVVRRMLASTMKPGVLRYNEILASHGLAPIPLDGFPHAPMASARRVFLNGSPGLEFPGYRPLAQRRVRRTARAGPRRARTGHAAASRGPRPPREGGRRVAGDGRQHRPDQADRARAGGAGRRAVRRCGDDSRRQTAELRGRFASSNVVIEDFVDYDTLFPHADVFVTNGGFGSVLAAMRHGVPVVGAGKTEGKNDIDARIGYNRLGVDLRSERPRPARIRAAVRRVLADPRFAANVAALRAELESYDPLARIEAVLHDEMLTTQP